MVTRSPTRTSRSSETDIEESIARREFVTFMTRPATVLPRLALTASTRTGRFEKNRTSFAGTWTPVFCASRPTSPSGAALLAGARRDDRAQRARVDLPGEQPRLERVEPDRAPGGDRALLRAPELGGGDVDVADELRAVVVRARDVRAGRDRMAFAAAFDGREIGLRLGDALGRELRAGLRGLAVAQRRVAASSNRRASAWRASSTAAFSAPCLATTSALACACRAGRWRSRRPSRTTRSRPRPARPRAWPARSRPAGSPSRRRPGPCCVDARLRDVRGPHGALRLLDAALGLQPGVARLRGRRLGDVQLVELRVGRPERVPALAEVEARDGHLGRRVVAAVHRTGGDPEPSQRTLELEHVLPTVAGTEVAVHRDRRRAARTPAGRRRSWRPPRRRARRAASARG